VRTYVIDASVAVKWVLPAASEPLSSEALALLKSYAEGALRFVVPDLFWAEFANILWKAVQQRRIRVASAESALRAMRDRNFPTVSSHLIERCTMRFTLLWRSLPNRNWLRRMSAWRTRSLPICP
jgi:predicted nucleic acid-binding protein